jgi:hypothetical protein
MLNHSSIVAGARSSGAKVAVFQHNCKLISASAHILFSYYFIIIIIWTLQKKYLFNKEEGLFCF